MSQFFCASSNQWVNSGCKQTPPSPNPPSAYPVFDPTTNRWIASGGYGQGDFLSDKSYFSVAQNSWTSPMADGMVMADSMVFILWTVRLTMSDVMSLRDAMVHTP